LIVALRATGRGKQRPYDEMAPQAAPRPVVRRGADIGASHLIRKPLESRLA